MEDLKKQVVIKTAKHVPGEGTCQDFRTLLKESDKNLAQPLQIPELPERFEAVSLLGQGGMGTVYQVKDIKLGSQFAIKFMAQQSLPDETARQRFKSEAAAVHELVHPNIVQVYDYSITDPAPYIVMEYISGSSFDRVLARERVIEQQRLLNMILQICDALSYAHLHGVVHRDLKPSNIILHDSSDLVKLVDFGIAKVGPQNESATQLTQKGEVFGSPAYMSPEQACAGKVDHRSDLYSLGCIMYEALAGKPLFAGENAVQVLLQHLNNSTLDLTRKLLKKGYSKSLVAILEKLLEKEPARRYQSAAELAEDVRRVINNQLSIALIKKPFLISVSRNAFLVTLAGTCAAGVLGLCTYTTITVMQIRNAPNETKVLDSIVSRRNQAKELMNKFLNSKDEERMIALQALSTLLCNNSNQPLASMDLLDAKDQLALVGAFTSESSQDAKKQLLQIFVRVNKPEPSLVNLVSNVCLSNDETLSPLAVSCLSAWSPKADKAHQLKFSTTLSELLLKQKHEDLDDGDDYEGNGSIKQSIYTTLGNLNTFSDQAITNIRESAKTFRDDKGTGGYWKATHPLLQVSKVKGTYFPELASLLKGKRVRTEVLAELANLGPKAAPAVPHLLKLLRSADLSDFRYEQWRSIYHTLGAIGSAAADEAVPVLKSNFSRHYTSELPSIAKALAQMGPKGIAVLEEAANRKRFPYNQDPRSPESLNNAAIDAARDALCAEGEE